MGMNTGGRPDKLSPEKKNMLKDILDRGPKKYGYPTGLWTLKRIADVFLKEFGISYNTTHVWRVIRAMGYPARIPLETAIEKNPQSVSYAYG